MSKKNTKTEKIENTETTTENTMERTLSPVTFTIKHTVAGSVPVDVSSFLGVTAKRAREMLQRELTLRGMTEDTCIALGVSDCSIRYEFVSRKDEMVSFANAYENHRIVNLKTGEILCVRPSVTGRGPSRVVRWSDKIVDENSSNVNELENTLASSV